MERLICPPQGLLIVEEFHHLVRFLDQSTTLEQGVEHVTKDPEPSVDQLVRSLRLKV